MPARTSKTGISVASIKETELYGMIGQSTGEAQPLGDPAIEQKLFAAEDFYERDLAMRFAPARVFSTPETRATSADPTIQVTDFDPITDISEPAYDYPVQLWNYDRWGYLKLRNRPIRSITQVVMTWAGSFTVWKVPAEWIQTARRDGTINLVPTSGPALVTASFNAFMLSLFGGGRGFPHSIFVDYATGFDADELAWHHQDLLNGVRLRTLLLLAGIFSTIASGGRTSASLSLDGLSHSRGFGGKYGPYGAAIQVAMEQEEAIRESWRVKQQGLPMAIV